MRVIQKALTFDDVLLVPAQPHAAPARLVLQLQGREDRIGRSGQTWDGVRSQAPDAPGRQVDARRVASSATDRSGSPDVAPIGTGAHERHEPAGE